MVTVNVSGEFIPKAFNGVISFSSDDSEVPGDFDVQGNFTKDELQDLLSRITASSVEGYALSVDEPVPYMLLRSLEWLGFEFTWPAEWVNDDIDMLEEEEKN